MDSVFKMWCCVWEMWGKKIAEKKRKKRTEWEFLLFYLLFTLYTGYLYRKWFIQLIFRLVTQTFLRYVSAQPTDRARQKAVDSFFILWFWSARLTFCSALSALTTPSAWSFSSSSSCSSLGSQPNNHGASAFTSSAAVSSVSACSAVFCPLAVRALQAGLFILRRMFIIRHGCPQTPVSPLNKTKHALLLFNSHCIWKQVGENSAAAVFISSCGWVLLFRSELGFNVELCFNGSLLFGGDVCLLTTSQNGWACQIVGKAKLGNNASDLNKVTIFYETFY